MQAKNDRIFEKASSMLSGANGIVYLLFVGRDNYAANIQSIMTDALFADKSNVNQTMAKLTVGRTFLIYKRQFREKGARGRARQIYSANLLPIIATLNRFEIEFDETELVNAFAALSEASDCFPKYLTNIYQTFFIRKLTWHQILALYFNYLADVLRYSDLTAYPMPSILHLKEIKTEVMQRNPLIMQHLGAVASQLSSPWIGLNPQFKAQIDKARDELTSRESQSTKFLLFLRDLEKQGITDFSVLLSQVEQVRAVYEKLDELKAKLQEAEHKLSEVNQKKA